MNHEGIPIYGSLSFLLKIMKVEVAMLSVLGNDSESKKLKNS